MHAHAHLLRCIDVTAMAVVMGVRQVGDSVSIGQVEEGKLVVVSCRLACALLSHTFAQLQLPESASVLQPARNVSVHVPKALM